MKREAGARAAQLSWRAVDGAAVTIPDQGGWRVDPPFSRWAGCPIRTLHLAEFRRRAVALHEARVRVVIVFHSPMRDVAGVRGGLPFALVADPDKSTYRAFGAGRSPLAIGCPKACGALRRNAKAGRRARRIHGVAFGLPAGFLIEPSGRIAMAHDGRHADDRPAFEDVPACAARHVVRAAGAAPVPA